MTVQDQLTLIRDYIDEPVAQNWSDAQLLRFLNRRQAILATEIQHTYQDFFEKTIKFNGGNLTPGVELYDLPSDFIKFKRVERGDTYETIRPVDINEKAINVTTNNILTLTQANTGISYYMEGTQVGFTPIPTDAIPVNLTYVYRLADLVNTTDVSSIPAEWHNLMAVGAAIDAFIKDESDTSELRREWAEGLDRLHRTLRERQSQEPRYVRRVRDASTNLWM